jgi:hypothetical protein
MTSIRHFCIFAALALLLVAPSPAFAAGGAPKGGGDVGRTAKRLTDAESYVPLPTILVGLRTHPNVLGVLSIDIGVDCPDAALRRQVQTMMPRLRDNLRAAATDYATISYRMGGAPDPERIAVLLQGAVDRTLGRAGAKVLLSNLLITNRQT